MRVLIATDSFLPQINGVAETATAVASMLAARGHEVQLLAPGPGRQSLEGVSIDRLCSAPLPLYPQIRVAASPRLLRPSVRRHPPDAAIVLTPGPIGLSIAAAMPRRTRLIHIYTTDVPYYLAAYGLRALKPAVERALRWLSGRATLTLCPTEVVRRELLGREHPRLDVWGCGVDTELFQPARRADAMRWRLTGGEVTKPLVLYVGRLASEKRLLDLYEAARRLTGVRFALVGDGPQRDLLERRFSGLPSVFTGFLRGVALASAFASADLFVFPSVSETFGQVIPQAMASGLPAIVMGATAPAELVQDGIEGLHVTPRSPIALADAIRSLIADDDRRYRMSLAACAAAQRFSWSRLLDQLEDHLTGRSTSPLAVPVG